MGNFFVSGNKHVGLNKHVGRNMFSHSLLYQHYSSISEPLLTCWYYSLQNLYHSDEKGVGTCLSSKHVGMK